MDRKHHSKQKWLGRSIAAVLLFAVVLGASPARAQHPPIDESGLSTGRYSRMDALLEKTFLGIDVARATIRFGPETASELERVARGPAPDAAREEQIARIASRAPHASVRVRFLRDIGLDTFLDAARDTLTRARRAGMISEANYRHVSRNLRRWFAALRERGIREGDQLIYLARPRSLRTVYVDRRGREWIDQVDEGVEPRLAALAGYFAPGADLREPLIASLLRGRAS